MTRAEKDAAIGALIDLKARLAELDYPANHVSSVIVESVLTDVHRLITRRIEWLQSQYKAE